MEERKISMNASCFLVKDHSLLLGWEAPLYRWLKENGFVSWGRNGVYEGVDWVYINLNSKVFAPGMPGVKIASVIGEHALTLNEFKQIYIIFSKYNGLDLLQMSHEVQTGGKAFSPIDRG